MNTEPKAWQRGATYLVGDRVIHEGVEYIALQDNLSTDGYTISRVVVTSDATLSGIRIGQRAYLTAKVYVLNPYSGNEELSDNRIVTWASATPSIATVDDSGMVTAAAVGTFTIVATSEGTSGSIDGLVSLQVLAEIRISPSVVPTRSPGSTLQLTATGYDTDGAPFLGLSFAWSSDDPAKVSVNATGLLSFVAAGSALITVTSGGQSASIVANVGKAVGSVTLAPTTFTIPLNGSFQFAPPIVRDTDGVIVTGRVIDWQSTGPAVAGAPHGVVAMVSATGKVKGEANGTIIINAICEGVVSNDSVGSVGTVPLGTVATVVLTPAAATRAPNTTQQFTATAKDAGGQVIPSATFVWSISNTFIASISSTGLVTMYAAGTVTVTATTGSGPTARSGTAVLTIATGSLVTARVAITAPLALVMTYRVTGTETRAFAFTAYDASNVVLAGRVGVWSSSNPAAVTINPSTGLATAVGNGASNISVTVEGIVAEAVAVVTVKGTAQSMALTPTLPRLYINGGFGPPRPGNLQMVATTYDQFGNTLTDSYTFASANPSLVAVTSPAGVASAVAEGGPVTITATSVGTPALSAGTDVVVYPEFCFVAGTKVRLWDNAFTTKNIEDVKIGDQLAGWNETTQKLCLVMVTKLYRSETPETWTVRTNDGHAVVTTAEHPFYDSFNAGWMKAADLGTLAFLGMWGDKRVAYGAAASAYKNMRHDPVMVYNLEVEDAHTFFANDFLVHNKPLPGYTYSMTLSPLSIGIGPGQSTQITAHTYQTDVDMVTTEVFTSYHYTTDNPAVATVDASGLVTWVSVGTAVITVYADAVAATATVTVTASSVIPVSSVQIIGPPGFTEMTPDNSFRMGIGAGAGTTYQINANTFDINGVLLTGRLITYASSDPSIATVNSTGLVTGVAPGLVTITATSEGIGSVAVGHVFTNATVGNTALVVITDTDTVSGNNHRYDLPPVPVNSPIYHYDDTIPSGDQKQYYARSFAGDGTILGITEELFDTFTWGSNDAATVDVDVTGYITTLAVGISTIITATSVAKPAVSDTVNVRVNPPSCFPAGTLVTMADGSTKHIELVLADEAVLAFTAGELFVPATVLRVIIASHGPSIYALTAGGYRVMVTGDHPFLCADGQWTVAKHIQRGMSVMVRQEGVAISRAVTDIALVDFTGPVYTLSVQEPNTFIADSFIVHNK